MIKIIFDTDNTLGIQGRPMDDGITLLYLLGRSEEVDIVGITLNIGNGSIQEVRESTVTLLNEIHREDIPVLNGRNDINHFSTEADAAGNEAARFIAEQVSQNKGEIVYLGLGSLGNLCDAAIIYPEIFQHLKQVVLMGGITDDLYIHGTTPLSELNFSVNYRASAYVLPRANNVSIITGNNCLPVAAFPKDEFMDRMCMDGNPSGLFVAQKCGYRFRDKQAIYGADASYCWDGIAAVYLLRPDLFEDHIVDCDINEQDMETGYLHPCPEDEANARINIPVPISRIDIQNELYEGWLNLRIDNKIKSFSCTGLYLDKLVQPCILIELRTKPDHGFALYQRLIADGYVSSDLDPTGMYRTLKKMERDGYIAGEFESDSHSKKDKKGKARKIYSITDYGLRTLNTWKVSLERYQEHINRIINSIED